MPECTNCSSFIPPNETKCPVCGKPIADDIILDPELAKVDDKVHAHLISANLKKLRGDLEGAIQECIAALRINPDNVEAHSLLGDIYRDQGDLVEAERWYQIALDLNPESKVDKLRLEQLKTIDRSSKEKDAEESQPRSFFPSISNWLYAGILAVVIVAVLSVLIGPLIYNPANREMETPQVPRIKGAPNRIRHPQNLPAQSAANQLIASEQESTLIANLNNSTSIMAAKLQIVGLTIDPRNSTASITYIDLSGANEVPLYIRNSFNVAYEAFRHNPTLNVVIARALYSIPVNGRQSVQVVFAADLKREKVMHIDPASASVSQMTDTLENVWYYPGLAPESGQSSAAADQTHN